MEGSENKGCYGLKPHSNAY